MKPGAPSNERRIKAYKKLKELGYNVVLKQERKVA
jgi:DNA repair photolyase